MGVNSCNGQIKVEAKHMDANFLHVNFGLRG